MAACRSYSWFMALIFRYVKSSGNIERDEARQWLGLTGPGLEKRISADTHKPLSETWTIDKPHSTSRFSQDN